jgi:amino acid adenylation domain-containing protein
MQRGMLFHSISGQIPGVDIEQVLCALKEEVDARALAEAWQCVVDRHEILRTTFHWKEMAEPEQRVAHEVRVAFDRKSEGRNPKSEHLPVEQNPKIEIRMLAGEWAKWFEEWLEADRRRGFDLTKAPLMRLTLFRFGERDHLLVWTFHHLLLDARGIGMVLKDVFSVYDATLRGEELELPEPRPYREFVEWLEKQDTRAAERYWRERLEGYKGTPKLNLEPRTSNLEPRTLGWEAETWLSETLTAKLKNVATRASVTLNTILQGAWALMLSHYSGEEDIVFGAVRAGRRGNVEGADEVAGLFINTVPMRIRVNPEMALLPWLKEIRKDWVELRPFEHTPLADVQKWSGGGTPLFETLFNYQEPSWEDDLRSQRGKWSDREFGIHSRSNYPLVVDAYGGERVRIKILSHRNRFSEETIERMLGHLETVLEGMGKCGMRNAECEIGDDEPRTSNFERRTLNREDGKRRTGTSTDGKKLFELPILTEAERRKIFEEWNSTDAEFPENVCVHELFEVQAQRTPDALAVADERREITYRELNEHADRLALRLQTLGVGLDDRVGVCLERSVEMVTALLAIWKAGATYVPMDAEAPEARLAYMIEDARMGIVVTHEALGERLQGRIPKLEVVCMDGFVEESLVAPDGHAIRHAPTPCDRLASTGSDRLAYIIYTSGSTGAPKGVEIEHRSLMNLVAWHQRTYQVTPSDRATQIASPAFDASVWELWPYLTAGASVHIPNEETRLSPEHLVAWLVKNEITLTFIPTPLMEALFGVEWPAGGRLRAVLTGGDKLQLRPTEQFPATLVNHYGPTESTVVATAGIVEKLAQSTKLQTPSSKENPSTKSQKPYQAPAIGKPIANTRVYALDRYMRPVPVGVAGELYVGGVGLADGYLDRPELTAEKFVSNPFRDEGSGRDYERLYRTGDLVRWLSDGNLEFLGRLDDQIKVRGRRIEPGEIEAALRQFAGVSEAIVMLAGGSTGTAKEAGEAVLPDRDNGAHDESRALPSLRSPQVTAYVLRAPGAGINSKALRDFLKQRLPDYMIPAAFVILDVWPLTQNGKVDRRALPEPTFEARAEYTPPRTPTEEGLVEIWRQVLAVSGVGVDDNFFELGGHSLLATQVISRMRSRFGVELPLDDLFATPTVAELAKKIDLLRGDTQRGAGTLKGGHQTGADTRREPANRVAATGEGRNPEVEHPLSLAQERLWFFEQLEPGSPLNNIPLAFRLEGRGVDKSALERALNEIIRRHEPLRTAFSARNGKAVAIVQPEAPLALKEFDFTTSPERVRDSEARRKIEESARTHFYLSEAPLFRAELLRLNENECWLLLVTHHLVCDGWSLGVFYRELASLYSASTQGKSARLPELSVNYSEYARLQREALKGDGLDVPLAYWKEQLKVASPLAIPTDRPRPAVQSYRGGMKEFALPAVLTEAISDLSRREGVTVFMVLLAALQTLLRRYSGQEDIIIGSPIAGRNQLETENLVGVFLNSLPFRGDLTGDPTFHELLARTRRTALAAYAHQAVPFERLVDALQPERDLSRPPLFQVMLVLQNEPLRPLELKGLKLMPARVHSGTSKFDLSFSFEETCPTLGGYVEYNSDLFEGATIERMLGHFQTMLAAAVGNPAERISALPLLTDTERQQMLVTWNATDGEFPRDKIIHQLFEEQARRTPQAIAVVFGENELTYSELDSRAETLAQQLREVGVGPEGCVGLCLPRSLEMIVGLLGILKASGAYLPLDPAYPRERLEFMLDDSHARVLVTNENLRSQFSSADLKVVCLGNNEMNLVGGERVARTEMSALPNRSSGNLAYVIYTSGSTGKPKGVMVTHRNVVNFFTGMDRVLGTGPGIWLAVTSISFDISVLELFWTLTRGFTVVIAPDEQARSGWDIVPKAIRQHRVTHMQCTPSLAEALSAQPEFLSAMRELRTFVLGGEPLPVALADKLRREMPAQLFNFYGPTETTVWSTADRVDEIGTTVSIGRPIANTRIYILDPALQPVPAGVAGEIFIGGEGVARGYFNRPELTTDKFVRDPFSPDLAARLYRTGDLARYLPDGRIECLGRLDNQFKLRGHRIELGEIEAALGQHETVRECVVTVREGAPGDRRIVAYVVPAIAGHDLRDELRRFLKGKLPDHMIPAVFVLLGEFPHTPNGKVDRKQLPRPTEIGRDSETAFVAPANEIEKTIASVWQELLHLEHVGRDDNFFDLGGHSLLVVQAQARLHELLQVDLPVVRLFQYPTVGALAGSLSNRQKTDSLEKARNRARKQRQAFAHREPEEVIV